MGVGKHGMHMCEFMEVPHRALWDKDRNAQSTGICTEVTASDHSLQVLGETGEDQPLVASQASLGQGIFLINKHFRIASPNLTWTG